MWLNPPFPPQKKIDLERRKSLRSHTVLFAHVAQFLITAVSNLTQFSKNLITWLFTDYEMLLNESGKYLKNKMKNMIKNQEIIWVTLLFWIVSPDFSLMKGMQENNMSNIMNINLIECIF